MCFGCLHALPVLGDFRQTPEPFWRQLYKKFQGKAEQDMLHAACESDGSFDDRPLLQPLDQTLDYIIRFLEGLRAKSSRISGETREFVLKHVKDTLAWKSMPRSQQEVQDRITELNSVMTEIVANL